MISLLQHVPSLQTLELSENTPPVADMPQEIEYARKLKLNNVIITTSFLQRLSLPHRRNSSNPSNAFLPNLRHLQLTLHDEGLDQRALANAFISRCPDITQPRSHSKSLPDSSCYLRSFKVVVRSRHKEASFETLEALQCFRVAGVDFSFSVDLESLDDE